MGGGLLLARWSYIGKEYKRVGGILDELHNGRQAMHHGINGVQSCGYSCLAVAEGFD